MYIATEFFREGRAIRSPYRRLRSGTPLTLLRILPLEDSAPLKGGEEVFGGGDAWGSLSAPRGGAGRGEVGRRSRRCVTPAANKSQWMPIIRQ